MIEAIQERLRQEGTAERAAAEKRYLKSDLQFYGVGAPGLKRIEREFRRAMPLPELRELVRGLWNTGWYEPQALAVAFLSRAPLEWHDFDLLEALLRQSHTWALVDFLSTKVCAPLVKRFPESSAVLERWARDDDFWVRRAALLSLLPELREAGQWDLFVRLSVPMLGERQFFIRKAIGWVLREVSKRRPELVRDYLAAHPEASGLTRREASKYLLG